MNYNPYSLEGKTILITGASSGIGRATAIECSKLGAKCVITGRNKERLQETFDQLEGEGHIQVAADLTIAEEVDKLVTIIPNIDGLVNNAGILNYYPITHYSIEQIEHIFQTNTFAPMLLVKNVLRHKKMNRCGSIVVTSSAATKAATLGNGIYGASKAAITAYVKYAANELSSKQIRVNSVHPGMVETPLIHDGAVTDEELMKDMQHYPLKRYGKSEEIAWGIIYLLSDASAWITAQSLFIDGGITGIIQ